MPMVRRAVRVVDDDEEAAAHELHHAEPAKLTVEELDAALDQADELDAALEKALDLDGDGVVSNEEFVQAYDVNHDGVVSHEEFIEGEEKMRHLYADHLEIDLEKLIEKMAFEDEKRSCGTAAVMYFMFTALYIAVLTMQFNTSDSHQVTKGMQEFVESIDGWDGDDHDYDVDSGAGILEWTRDQLVPRVFGSRKYNDEKLALWERNYMMGHNKLIGGVFLMQTRGTRKDERFCTGRFSLFYPACYDEEPEVSGFGPEYQPELDETFQESVVVQSSFGTSTQEEVCAELALGGDGKFCVKCLKTMETGLEGQTIKFFTGTGDCAQCREQCQLLVGPNDDERLGTAEVCGLCTYQDTFSQSFSTVGDFYLGGLRDPSSQEPNPTEVYGWDREAPGAIDIHIVASRADVPSVDALIAAAAEAMHVPVERVRPHLAMDMVKKSRDGGGWTETFFPEVAAETAIRLHVLKGTNPTPVEAIDGLVTRWAAGGLTLAGKEVVAAVADHSVCTQDRTPCLAQVCEQCIDDTVERGEDLSKVEAPCSSDFSGGPLTDSAGMRYDCAVRLANGKTTSSEIHDEVTNGRVEVKSGNTWGTICSTGWDDRDADVLCRSIGYEGGVAKTVANRCTDITHSDWCENPEVTGGAIGQCASSTQYVDYTQQTDRAAATCNIKIIARAGLFGSESSWQLDPHLSGPGGTFSLDKEETQLAFDGMEPGIHKLQVSDTGNDGWQPPWEKDLVPVAPQCEGFWRWDIGDCRICLAQTSPVCTGTATDTQATPDCAAAFTSAADTTASSCPAGCLYEGVDYSACTSTCATCGSACTSLTSQESCEAVTWNARGNTPQAQCVAYDPDDAGAVTACAGVDLSTTDPYAYPGEACWDFQDAGGNWVCEYQEATHLCHYSATDGCQDIDPCPFSNDGMCDVGAPTWNCYEGDWLDCSNPLVCDVSIGRTCNDLLNTYGDDATAASVTIVERVCKDQSDVPCEPADAGCTCTDGQTQMLQYIHEGLNNDPLAVSGRWSFEVEFECGSCPGDKYLGSTSSRSGADMGGLGCDLQAALDDFEIGEWRSDCSGYGDSETQCHDDGGSHCAWGFSYCDLITLSAEWSCSSDLHDVLPALFAAGSALGDLCTQQCSGYGTDDSDGVLAALAASSLDDGTLDELCNTFGCSEGCSSRPLAELSTCSCREWTESSCSAPYGQGSGPVWLANVHCSGDESSLCECKQDDISGPTVVWGAGLWACDNAHSLDAGVECHGRQAPQPARIEDCQGVCVPAAVKGDGWCDEGEYNAYMNCQQLGCDGGDCIEDTCEDAPARCASGRWGCDNGVCIEGYQRCDNVPQCGGGDKSDERHCSGVFCCNDGSDCIPNAWRNDGWPDCQDGSDEAELAAYNKATYNFNGLYCRGILPQCDIYMQDRALSCSASILPTVGCPPSQWGNGQCDPLCGTEACRFDGGDCPDFDMVMCEYARTDDLYGVAGDGMRVPCSDWSSTFNRDQCTAAAQCRWSVVNNTETGAVETECVDDPLGFYYNGKCDLEFNTSSCSFDNEECLKCSWEDDGHDCLPSMLGDGFCDWDCQTANCNFDDGDCPAVQDDCPASTDFLGDGNCDTYFNSDSCGCDMGDCAVKGVTTTMGTRVFACGSMQLFSQQVCDGVSDCFNGEDEFGCNRQAECSQTYVRLHTEDYGSEVQFSIDDGQRFGDPSRLCTASDCTEPCHDGGTDCVPFASNSDYKLDLHLTPGTYTLHAIDIAGDGWGDGAIFSIMQMNPRTNREISILTLSAADVASTNTGGADFEFDLACAPATQDSRAACSAANNTWDSSVNEICETAAPCTGTATDADMYPSCTDAFRAINACPAGCLFSGPVDARIMTIYAGTDTIVLSSDMSGAVSPGQTLVLTDVGTGNCRATPKDTNLIVESVSNCGKEIKFSTDITATHRHVRRDCKLISPCGQADISGDVAASRQACEAAAGGRGACTYQPENHLCRATDNSNSAVKKTCSDGTTVPNAKVCDGRVDCPWNPSCAAISGASVASIFVDNSMPVSTRQHTVTLSTADPSIVPGQALRLTDAPGMNCAARPKSSDLFVVSVCGEVIELTGITATDASASDNCVVTRTPAPACIEDEMCFFECSDQPCAPADLVSFPHDLDGCRPDMQGDGICNPICFTASCNFDAKNDGSSGDCEQCGTGCYEWIRGDGTCNPECATPACGYDSRADGTGAADCNSDPSSIPQPDTCAAATTVDQCEGCSSAIAAVREDDACLLQNMCQLTSGGLPCVGVSDLAWSREFLIEMSASQQTIAASVRVDVSVAYQSAVLASNGFNARQRLEESLRESIGRALVLPAFEVEILGTSDPAAGRRQLQSSAQLSVDYEVACTYCELCSTANDAAACAAVGATGTCVWGSGCEATTRADATSTKFAKGILGAFINSASSCCPGPTESSPPICSEGCDGAYGADAILASVDTIASSLAAPQVVTLEDDWMDRLECAPDAQWPGADAIAAGASLFQESDEIGCLSTMVLDGVCQCDCTAQFQNPLCTINDVASGDCSDEQIASCNGVTGNSVMCPFYLDPVSCTGDEACSWRMEDLGCWMLMDEWDCTGSSAGCLWDSDFWFCSDPPPCGLAPCGVDEHVADGACASCPAGTFSFGGDVPDRGNTPCRSQGKPCDASGISLSASTHGEIGFTFDSAPAGDWEFVGGNYGNGAACTWSIVCPSGTTSSLVFKTMDTEHGWDFVTVYDGDSTDAGQLARFDGTNAYPVSSSGETMLVQFTSDGSVTRQGFLASYCCDTDGSCAFSDTADASSGSEGIGDAWPLCTDNSGCTDSFCAVTCYTGGCAEDNDPTRSGGFCQPCWECYSDEDAVDSAGCGTVCGMGMGGMYPEAEPVDPDWSGTGFSCDAMPCENDGTCTEDPFGTFGYVCTCTTDWMGDNCEIDMSGGGGTGFSCDAMPCENDGTCTEDPFGTFGYVCTCLTGWEGDNCEVADVGRRRLASLAHAKRQRSNAGRQSFARPAYNVSASTRAGALVARALPPADSASRRRLGRAAEAAVREIPANFITTSTPPPPPPPVKIIAPQTQVEAVTVNMSSAGLAPATALGLGGFTARCDSKEEECSDEEKKFMYFIEITQDQEVERIQRKMQATLIDQLWIDGQTRTVEIRFATYNGNLGLFTIVQIQFEFALGGKVTKELEITVLDLELVRSTDEKPDGTVREIGTKWEDVRMGMEASLVVGVLLITLGELKDMRDAKVMLGSYHRYFSGPSSFWNIIDCAHIALYVVSIIYWLRMFIGSFSIEPPQYFDWSEDEKLKELLDTTNDIMFQASLFQFYTALTVANLFVVLLLVFKFTRFQGKLAVVNGTFYYAGENLFHFSIIFAVTIFMFSIMGKIIFGQKMEAYSSFHGSFNANFLIALGDWGEEGLEGLIDAGGPWGEVFFFAYIFLVFFTMVNFFLAIVMEAYDKANSEAAEAATVQAELFGGMAKLRDRLCRRNVVAPIMKLKADKYGRKYDMGRILDPRVMGIIQETLYQQELHVVDAGTLRKHIVKRFEKDDAGRLGMAIANALLMWYFEAIDPDAAPKHVVELEATDKKVEDLQGEVKQLHTKLDTVMKMMHLQSQMLAQ